MWKNIKDHLTSMTNTLLGRKPIEIFVRHCNFSKLSYNKERIFGFSKKLCHQNLMETTDWNKANITFFLDTFVPTQEKHFLYEEQEKEKKQGREIRIIEMQQGTEAKAFLFMLDYVKKLALRPDTIVYFLEDDYLHRPGWTDILLEGFKIPKVDYVTLYDHNDKYFFPEYQELKSKIFCSPSSHWRETPSTTNTYAMRFSILLRDLEIHEKYSENCEISKDHAKFCELSKKFLLISPIPGWSTHCEPKYASPCIDWERFFMKKNSC
jgi:hypothetical protein